MQQRHPVARFNGTNPNQMSAAAVVAAPCTSLHRWNSWSSDVLRSGLATKTMTAPVTTYLRHPAQNPAYPSQPKHFGGTRHQNHIATESPVMQKPQLSPTMQDVASWLKSLRLHKYTEMLQSMSYEEMLSLDEECLLERGVTTGARRKLVQCINKLRDRVPVLRSFVDEKGEPLLDIAIVIAEVRTILSTPMKPYDCGYQQQGFGAAMTDLDEKNLPGHIICLLERIHERRCRQRKNIEGLVNLLEVYERIMKHHAFTESQKRRVVGWRTAVITMINQQQPDLLATRKRVSKDGMSRNGYRNRRPQDGTRRQQKTLTIPPPPPTSGDVLEDAKANVFYWSQVSKIAEAQSQIAGPDGPELRRKCSLEIQIARNQMAHILEIRAEEHRRLQKRRQQEQFQLVFGSPAPYRRWSNGSSQQDNNGVENSWSDHKQSSFSLSSLSSALPSSLRHNDIFTCFPPPQHFSFSDWNNALSNTPQAPSSASSTSSGSFPSFSDRSGSPPQVLSPPAESTHSPSPSMSSNDFDENTDLIVYDFDEHNFDDAVCNDISLGFFNRPATSSYSIPIGTGRKLKPLTRQESQSLWTVAAN
ncbi:hypothetical protein QR680_006103 [Steinernema hermaphroditum]|uniref:SAM domain-containing protein n=1 Tax=Steinernema hermaphroditum TaxID=289476 RepID=A0AA39LVZ4_9BILA|nr:hypothetical protein QR680_006103 [Steinernema hermaphroditum]